MGATAVNFETNTRLVRTDCYRCSVPIWMSEAAHTDAQRAGPERTFYCLNGHGQVFGESEAQRLQKQLAEKDKALTAVRSQAAQAIFEKQNAEAAKAKAETALTRLRRRAKNGVCPCCTRSFTDLRRHMTTKHPTFADPTK